MNLYITESSVGTFAKFQIVNSFVQKWKNSKHIKNKTIIDLL